MLNIENSALVIIDIQEKLVLAAKDGDEVAQNTAKLVETANILNIPTIVTEQYPKGLGSTVDIVKNIFSDSTPTIEKTSFSAMLEPDFANRIAELKNRGINQIVLCGIETHICVHQTVAALLREGFEVYVAKDACASRNKYEFKQGIELMQANGATISCMEIILFEWLKSAKNPYFKEIQALIK